MKILTAIFVVMGIVGIGTGAYGAVLISILMLALINHAEGEFQKRAKEEQAKQDTRPD